MKIICFSVMLLFQVVCVYSQANKIVENFNNEFIVIANTGSSNYSLSPIVISMDTVNIITYDTTIYDQNVKYRGFTNIILKENEYRLLFSFLNIYLTPKERPLKFIKDNKYSFIIDYRDYDGNDFELFSARNTQCILSELKLIYYFVRISISSDILEECIEDYYRFYAAKDDTNGTKYKRSIR